MYVSERNADSICETELAFLVTKSSYMPNHFGGRLMVSGIREWACLYISAIEPETRLAAMAKQLTG